MRDYSKFKFPIKLSYFDCKKIISIVEYDGKAYLFPHYLREKFKNQTDGVDITERDLNNLTDECYEYVYNNYLNS